MKWLSRKNTLIILLVVFALFVLVQNLDLYDLCVNQGLQGSFCGSLAFGANWGLLALSLLFLPVIFMLPLRETVFIKWKKFSVWAIPVVVVGTYFAARMSSEGFIDIRPILYITTLYVGYYLASLYIMATNSFRKDKTIANKQ